MNKKVVRFITAIALVIAITSSAALASDILAESKARGTEAADSSKITETGRVEEDSSEPRDMSEEGILAQIKKETQMMEEIEKQIEEKYTVGSLSDFGAAKGWRAIFDGDDMPVFPISEYEELDEFLQFLKNYNIYIPTSMLVEMFPDEISSLNVYLHIWVDYFYEDISNRISEGTMPTTYTIGDSRRIINVGSSVLFKEQIYCVVADYYFGYDFTSSWS